jgi:phospholipid-translocating ATPase
MTCSSPPPPLLCVVCCVLFVVLMPFVCAVVQVALEINRWHYLMVIAELFSVLAYFASIFILKTYFGTSSHPLPTALLCFLASHLSACGFFCFADITFILTWNFAWKVAVITSVSTLPPAILTLVYRKYAPAAHSKVNS